MSCSVDYNVKKVEAQYFAPLLFNIIFLFVR